VGGAHVGGEEGCEDADAEIGKRCRSLGIPEEFRPRLSLGWYDRGENASKARRAELRKVAQTRIAAMAAAARVELETKALDGLTLLAAGSLESAEARAFLAEMPSVELLMPAFDVSVLGPMRALAPKDEAPEEDPD
jgi:hypothetical protein